LTDNRQLEALYRNVRDKMKCGDLDGFQKGDIQTIYKLIRDNSHNCPFDRDSLQYDFFKLQSYLHILKEAQDERFLNSNSLYLKAVSISLEFGDYLEELQYDQRRLLSTLASKFLEEFNSGTLKLSTTNDQELLKEKARLVSTYANHLWRSHFYEEAERAVKSATRIVLTALRPKGIQCNTVLGALYYVESKLLRHYGKYKECEERLTKAIDCYSLWVMYNSKNPKNIQLASYKTAIFLGEIAWCKNSRGRCIDALALINSARLLILPTEWQLDKARLNLIYADVARAFFGTDSSLLGEPISVVNHSYSVFKKHSHDRLKSRAAYSLAVLNYYGNNLPRAEQSLNEVERFSEKSKDVRWRVNCWTLMARIRIKQGRVDNALSLLSQSIDHATTHRLMDQLVVAHIVKGEAYCLKGNYVEAVESFEEASKLNEKRIGAGIEVSSERNKGWILLSLAHVHLLNNDVGQAKAYLERWDHLGSVEFKWLHEHAEQIRQAIKARLPKDFTIKSGTSSLNWKRHENELAAWLINEAKLQIGSEKDSDIADAIGISTRRLGQLKSETKEKLSTPKINFLRRSKKS
jgi:tetratricopeptide (TPR) repeat protein